jgi:hypothetical protein
VRAMLIVFVVVKPLEAVLTRSSRYVDSSTYRVKDRWFDLSLTSLDGHSIRPWGVTLWMALWPSDRAITVAQALLSAVVWSALGLTVAVVIRRPAVRRVLVAALLLLACTAQVAGWDLAIMSESVSVSTGVLALAALIWLGDRPSWARATAFLAAALWFTMTRPNVFVILLAWAVALLIVGLLRRQRMMLGVVAGVLVVFCVYSYVYNVRSDAAWTKAFGYSRTTVAYAYPISGNGPVGKYIIRDLRNSDAPACMVPRSRRVVSDHGTAAWVLKTLRTCPGMNEWATENWNRWYATWLVHHPGKALQIIRVALPSALSPPVWTGVTAATPNAISSLYFGSVAQPQSYRSDETYRTQPLLLWIGAAAVLALLTRGRWRGSRWDRDLVLVATGLGALAAAVSSVLLIQVAAFEVGQESLGALIMLTISAVMLVGSALDRFLAPGPAAPGDSTGEAEVPAQS